MAEKFTPRREAVGENPAEEVAQPKISPAHRQLLIDEAFEGKQTAAQQGYKQNLVLAGGPPGAGKSTSLRALGINAKQMVHADADLIKEKDGFAHRETDKAMGNALC